jgi:hypothetical protein
VGFASLVLAAGDARAFCRTTACQLPQDFAPSLENCTPPGFAKYCEGLSPPATPVPIWWRNACVSYDLTRDGTRQIAYDTISRIVASAFAKWTGTTCATDGSSASRVSIDVRDLGPVDCDRVQYNSNQGNQHVIIFDDDVWPHNDANNTLGLTTVTFDPDTGEIYDADMEINATVPLSIGDPVPASGYDLESIVTHEAGHFLGMAHSGDERATMFAHYAPGSSSMRLLTGDDVGGICTIYPPGGTRSVDPSVPGASKGRLEEATCDPTPRHGFSTECAIPPNKACVASIGAAPEGRRRGSASSAWCLVAGVFALGLGLVRRRLRTAPRPRG